MDEETLQTVLHELEDLLRAGNSLDISLIKEPTADDMRALGQQSLFKSEGRRCLVLIKLPGGRVKCIKWEEDDGKATRRPTAFGSGS